MRKRRQKSSLLSQLEYFTGIRSQHGASMAPETCCFGAAQPRLRNLHHQPASRRRGCFRKVCASLGGNAASGRSPRWSKRNGRDACSAPPALRELRACSPGDRARFRRSLIAKFPASKSSRSNFPGGRQTWLAMTAPIGWHGTPLREDTGGELGLLKELAEFPQSQILGTIIRRFR